MVHRLLAVSKDAHGDRRLPGWNIGGQRGGQYGGEEEHHRLVQPIHFDFVDSTAQAIEAGLVGQVDLDILRTQFQPQQYASYCGVASSVMVLRSLGVSHVSQDNFFSDATKSIHSRYDTFFGGMTLAQLGGLLHAHGVQAQVFHAEDSKLEEFRKRVSQNLKEKDNFVLVNYLRKAIHQKTGGHISPIAAYDNKSDRFLVMDVAAHKYPPVWVKAEELWKSLNTVDSDSGRSRGYVLVEKTN